MASVARCDLGLSYGGSSRIKKRAGVKDVLKVGSLRLATRLDMEGEEEGETTNLVFGSSNWVNWVNGKQGIGSGGTNGKFSFGHVEF